MPTKQPWYKSVADPSSLALTAKGIMVGAIPTALIVLKLFGHSVAPVDAQAVVDSVGNVLTAIAATISVVITSLGVIRKVYYSYFK